jgi:hypothetical protein
MSARRPSILAEVFIVFPNLLQENAAIMPQIVRDTFFSQISDPIGLFKIILPLSGI